jgi:organic hydroperoxide reductase OsmC/OhrA
MTTMQAIKQPTMQVNGLDMEAAFATVDAIKANPELARFQFRARNSWISGGENRSKIQDFYGAGREDDSRAVAFEMTNGEPPILLGNNEGANPVEYLLHALAGCVTTTLILHAAVRGITIRELSSDARVRGRELRHAPASCEALRSGAPALLGHEASCDRRHRR